MRYVTCLALLVFASIASAIEPPSGLWYNQATSGRGWSIDYQNGVLVVTGYVYNPDGSATFVQAANTYNPDGNTFSGSLIQNDHGQCFSCPYVKPDSAVIGTLSLQFTSTTTATITFPGGSDFIAYSLYGYGGSANNFVLGSWVFDIDFGSSTSSEWVRFTTFSTTNGTVFIDGSGDPNIIATATFDASGNLFVLTEDSVGFEKAYNFERIDDKRGVGLGGIGPAGTTPPLVEPSAANHILDSAESNARPAAKALFAPRDLTSLHDQLAAIVRTE